MYLGCTLILAQRMSQGRVEFFALTSLPPEVRRHMQEVRYTSHAFYMYTLSSFNIAFLDDAIKYNVLNITSTPVHKNIVWEQGTISKKGVPFTAANHPLPCVYKHQSLLKSQNNKVWWNDG